MVWTIFRCALLGVVLQQNFDNSAFVSGSEKDLWRSFSEKTLAIDGISEHSGDSQDKYDKWEKFKTLRSGRCPFKQSQIVKLAGSSNFYAKLCLPDAPSSPSEDQLREFEQDLLANLVMAPVPVALTPTPVLQTPTPVLQTPTPPGAIPNGIVQIRSSAVWLTGNDSLVLFVLLFLIISAYVFQPI
ncbi:hypothetical protein GE061_005586 [Apolygus lucorum]|uniref:Uncharacterized protein n=1 Tax=Apolygus lucorum TaxID=248454 RepID=A0A6A4IQA6_APOLU|nr:hypothetical protein GE061_005586 [Apolygus lucorum]